MILIPTNEENFAKLVDGKPVFPEPATKTVSEDKLTTTVVTKAVSVLEEQGFKRFIVKREGQPGPNKVLTVTWYEEDGKLYKKEVWAERK